MYCDDTINRTYAMVKTSGVPTRQKNSREHSFVKDRLNATQDTIPTQLTTVSNSRATLSNNHSAFLFAQDSSKPGSSLCTPKPTQQQKGGFMKATKSSKMKKKLR